MESFQAQFKELPIQSEVNDESTANSNASRARRTLQDHWGVDSRPALSAETDLRDVSGNRTSESRKWQIGRSRQF